MAEYTSIKELFVDTCNAIREKTGTTEPIVHNEIADAIRSISGGSSDIKTYDNTFSTYLKERNYSSANTTYSALQSELNAHVAANPNNEYDLKYMIEISEEEDNEFEYDINLVDISTFTCPTMEVVNLDYAFKDTMLQTIDISNVTLSPKMKSLERTFDHGRVRWKSEAPKLTKINGIENLDIKNIQNLSHTFDGCSGLTSLDLSNWDASNVTETQYLFNDCLALTSLKLPQNMNNIKNAYYMFSGCSNLTSLDVSNFSTENIENMNGIFYDCSSLTSLDLSNWNTSKAKEMGSLFRGCTNLTSIDVSNFDLTNTAYVTSMFENCSGLTSLDLSNWDVSNVERMDYLFDGCTNLVSIDLTGWDTSGLTGANQIFRNCSSLTSLDLSNWNTSKINSFYGLFEGCSNLKTLNLSSWDFNGAAQTSGLQGFFRDCSFLTDINLANCNTSAVTRMSEVFSGCTSLTSLNLTGWDTSAAEDMSGMFYNCFNLTSLDISSFSTASCSRINNMISYCTNLTNLKIGGFFEDAPEQIDTFYWITELPSTFVIDFDEHCLSKNNYMELRLDGVWRNGTEEEIIAFETSINSLGAMQYAGEQAQIIYIHTNLYNALSDEQKALVTSKGYELAEMW